ncbi:MAG: pyridoxamine 5'-phosphate oxidase family protein [Spirochaetales bacterium]|nr:pyridoxamine 5'-phosphate oxidase family protein [Spirochaetales bacterium]
MRRKDREVAGDQEKLDILSRCKVCRVGLSQDGQPYVFPLNFGFEFERGNLALFFHSAGEGKKWEIIKGNPRCAFEADIEKGLITAPADCEYSYGYASLMGLGHIEILTDREEKVRGLEKIMAHQTGRPQGSFQFEENALDHVRVYRMIVDGWTGKQRS